MMTAYEKLERLEEVLGAEGLLDNVFQWFSTSTLDECFDDIARTWDVEFEEEER